MSDQASNRQQLLNAIRSTGPVSRTELTALTSLSSATVTQATRDMILRGLIVEERTSPSRGRPRVALSLHPGGAYGIGASPTSDGALAIEIVDLRGDRVFARSGPLGTMASLAALGERCGLLIREAVEASGIAPGLIRSVGVALPGLLDSVGGIVHWMVTLPRELTPVAAIIERHVGIPVVLNNLTDVVARAEHWFGGRRDFFLLDIGMGFGAGRYTRGKLWVGANGLNPEFSHTKVVPVNGDPCFCGGRGCVAAHCSMMEVATRIARVSQQPVPAFGNAAAARVVLRDADPSVPAVAGIFERAGYLLGAALASYVNATDPGHVILHCHIPRVREFLEVTVMAALADHLLPSLRDCTTVQFRDADPGFSTKGAAALALEQLFVS